MKKLLLLTSVALVAGFSAQADTIADWTFENFGPLGPTNAGPWSAAVGSGNATSLHAGTTTYSTVVGNGSGHSFSANNWAVGDYFQFQFSTSGFSTVILSFDQTSSSTGPGKFNLEYSTDGTTFNPIGSDYSVLGNGTAPNASWNGTTVGPAYTTTLNLSSLIGNDPTVYIRMVDDSTTSASGGTVGTAGTDRMDNIVVDGELPDQTSTMALLGFAVVGLGISARLLKK